MDAAAAALVIVAKTPIGAFCSARHDAGAHACCRRDTERSSFMRLAFGTFQSFKQCLDPLVVLFLGVALKVAHRSAYVKIPIAQIRLITAGLVYGLPNMSRWYLHCLPGNSFNANNAKRLSKVPLACTGNISSVLFAVLLVDQCFLNRADTLASRSRGRSGNKGEPTRVSISVAQTRR
jgi:hypothetical protein